jgi:predicted acyl esterase
VRVYHNVCLVVAAFGLIVLSPSLHAVDSNPVSVEYGVEAKMRDGTVLRADVYRPKVEGSFPVLLERTPYNKSGSAGFAIKAATRGYIVVVQDVRGRYASDGDWYPFKKQIT